ncbi:PREDICTED: uncharacterized protein LOC104709899 [Camelina sativa]|uniref:Uncharacterized protein LOC104709899 n=1 Tax=Camelina sativa TaxID=90675 RepID=A0ABM1QC92_CAMSA|nr:PREDICTED: uncharacterized protein LOC104709899 [Camelina sativa]
MRDYTENKGGSDAFVTKGFNTWKNPQSLRDHVGSLNSFHNNALKNADALMKQKLSFRGHDESMESANRGNFLELVKLSMKQLRGQGYDGAIGTSCKRKDMIREEYRKRIEEGISRGEIKTGKGLNQELSLQRPGNTCWDSHYTTLLRLVDLFSIIIKEFNDRFDEVNTELLGCVASLSLIDSFHEFDPLKVMRLSEFYPKDFTSVDRISLEHQLGLYIDNIREDERFANLKSLGDLAHVIVETRKYLSYPQVYRLLKLVLTLPIATTTVERCFSAMNIVKTSLRNRIGDKFLNDCLVSFIEKELFDKMTNEIVMKMFQDMKERRITL